MENLVIHLGLHKTGTTALQDYLGANDAKLLRRGTTYIAIERMRKDITPLFCNADHRKREEAKSLFEGIPTRALILSDENIAGGTEDIMEGGFYTEAGGKLTSILAVLQESEIHLVLALRDPTELVPALYSEYLRMHDFVSFQTYVANFDLASISYWETFAWMRSLPRNVRAHIIPFEARFGGGVASVAATILRAATGSSVGFDLRTFYENRVRASFTAEEIELATTIARTSSAKVAHLFLRNIDHVGGRFGNRRYSPVEPSVAAVVSQRYERDLTRWRNLQLDTDPST